MTDDERDKDLRRRWWVRMRRAYNIPDLVSDDLARDAIVSHLAAGGFLPNLPNKEVAVGSIVDNIPEFGSRGRLDHRIIGNPFKEHLTAEPESVLLDELVLSGRRAPDAGYASDTARGLVEIAKSILSSLERHIASNPFEDGDGRYFGTNPSSPEDKA